MVRFMEWLNQRLSFVNTRSFYWVFTIGISLNPIALWIQAYWAWSAASIAGLSLLTFSLMLLLQILTIGYGILKKDPAIFLVMTTAVGATVVILSAILLR